MHKTHPAAAHETQSSPAFLLIRRVKRAAVVLLLAGTGFTATGCYDDPYYRPRYVRAGYYSAPDPYYGYDPYAYQPYGYGYGTGVGVGISTYRPGYTRYGRRPYYGRNHYGRPRYHHRGDYPRNWERRRRGDNRDWRRDRDRSRDGRARTHGNRAIRRSTVPPQREEGAPVEAQPE